MLKDPANRHKTLKEKAALAGITHQYIYELFKKPHFLQALKLSNLSCVVLNSPQIVQRVCEDAVKGNYMQQKMALEMSGDYEPHSDVPQINQIIANFSKNTGISEDEVDKAISSYFVQNKKYSQVIEVQEERGKT